MKYFAAVITFLISLTLIAAPSATAQSSFLGSSSSNAPIFNPPAPPVADVSAAEQQIFSDINNYRAANGLIPITWNNSYYQEALDWGHTMNNGNFFAHPTNVNRFENIYFTPTNPTDAFEGWRNSPGHNSNMLNASFTSGAVAVVEGSLPAYGNGYFVVLRGFFY